MNPPGAGNDTADDEADNDVEGDGHEPGRPSQSEKKESLPPGAGTRGEDDDIDGNAGWGAPFEDAPAEGRLAPDGDNPPP